MYVRMCTSNEQTLANSLAVLEKVEQQIHECRERLRKKLQELPAPIEEQKKLIK